MSDRAFNVLQKLSQKAQHSFFTLGNHDYHGHTPLAVGDWITRAGFHEITRDGEVLRQASWALATAGRCGAYVSGLRKGDKGSRNSFFHHLCNLSR